MDVSIVIDTEFLNNNLISGNCLQLGFVAIKHNHVFENESDFACVNEFNLKDNNDKT